MTSRKKKAVGFGVTAALFALFAGIFGFTDADPSWLGNLVAIVAAVAGAVGLSIVIPEE